MPPVPKKQIYKSHSHSQFTSPPKWNVVVHRENIMDHLLNIRTLLKLAKSYHRVDQEPDHCSLHDCGAFFVVVGFQALFHDSARWHVLELEQESPEHGLHCPHEHTNTATLSQFV